ncbi:hypothetical protein GCK72_015895 [Caenorhabditis remanei]|uniref:Uncharacterized protein n=1 Tax=Caenorhabditis remanei TaxID=31234 RepID=A0A6A5GVD0_CAERE|nr:hypothetical protein GCK72_015895 [Caenorhabditis remanei]KAF1759428.1 hypothetical protein GCK72_015895 [Caenorhabditis remanei]
MNYQELLSFLQNPQVKELFTKFQAALNADSQLNAYQAKTQSLGTENAELIQQLRNMKVAMLELVAERDVLRGQHAAILGERDFYMQANKLRAKDLTDKNLEIQALEDKLAASQEQSTRNSMKLLEQHDKELYDKSLAILQLDSHLSAAKQETIDKLKVLQEQHDKQIMNKDLEIQTLQEKLATGQGQHAKVLNDKDLPIQELETRLPAAEQQPVYKILEFTNENNLRSLMLQVDSIRARPLGVKGLQKKLQVPQKKKKVVPKPTQLHTELGKLYIELQEAKKPQEALMAQLAAKDKEIEYLMEQLEGKNSEIQNLKEMIQEGDEMNENVMAKDGKIEAFVADWVAKLKRDRDGQSE